MVKKTVILIAIIILLISLNTIILSAGTETNAVTDNNQNEDGAEDTELIQKSPINPDFSAYLQKSSEISYGYIPPLMDLRHLNELPVNQPIKSDLLLPSSFDWRDSDDVTSIKNQKPCGTCWSFGTTSVLESAILINENLEYNLSEQSVALCVDRSWVYLYDDSDDPCMGGGWGWLASEVFIKKGAVLESCNPYDTSALNCDGSCTCDDCMPVKKVEGYRFVTNDGSQINLIKNAIYDHGPVTMAFRYDSNYNYTDPVYGCIYDYYPCSEYPNHIVSIIGWDDSVTHPNPAHSGTGAWIVKNSWGPDRGNDGFFYLAYDSSCVEEIAYLGYKDHNPDEELLYWDEAGLIGSIGCGFNNAWMANVFTAPRSGEITHVDFWTTSTNAQYEIYIWDGYFGSELINQAGSCSNFGYYSIPLDNPISIDADQQFTVSINMTTPGYDYPIPIEDYIAGFVDPPIQSDVSFVRCSSTSDWIDLYDLDWNACLRARILSPSQGICGDIDENGIVNIVDVRLLMNHVVDPVGYPVSIEVADVDGDTDIDEDDVQLLVMHVFNPYAYLLNC